MEMLNFIWPWLAIWLAWVWVAIWQWILAKKAIEMMWKNPKEYVFYMVVAILWLALVESAAIYWLIVSFQLLGSESIWLFSSIAAWLSIWLTGLWVWIWEWKLVAWALWAMERNPKIKYNLLWFMVLFLALIEVSAVYWLVISFMIINSWIEHASFMWAWFAIWLAGLWVAVWRGYLTERSIEIMWANSKEMISYLAISILWIALAETAAIYWIIVSFSIVQNDISLLLNSYAAIGAWVGIWIAWLWVWLWQGLIVAWAMTAINKAPEFKTKILSSMVLFVALAETAAIYALILAFNTIY